MAAKIKFPLRLVYPDWVPVPSPGDNDLTGIFADDEKAAKLKTEVAEAEARLAKIKSDATIA